MTTFVLVIETDGEAFEAAPSYEVHAIAARACQHMQDGTNAAPLRDANGNTVGFFQWPADTALVEAIRSVHPNAQGGTRP